MSALPPDHVPGTTITREKEATFALGNTVLSPRLARAMLLTFLVLICAVPLFDQAAQIRENRVAGNHWLPQSREFFSLFPSPSQILAARSVADAERLLPRVSDIKSYEAALEEHSHLSQWLLPRAQSILTRFGGVGNEQAYLGRDRWLFYRPDVEYLTSPGFLDASLLAMRYRSGGEDSATVQPDPVRAIIDFRDQLEKRGITLIVMPVPVKPMLEAEKLSSRAGAVSAELQNPSYSQFLTSLAQHRVLVYDPAADLRRQKVRTGKPQFLQTDTHWTPEAMHEAASGLAAFVQRDTGFNLRHSEYLNRQKNHAALGDIAQMLGLPEDQNLFALQAITLQQVLDARGQLWQSDAGAELLLLGDSFSNIYSQPGLGWGEGAGLGAQLAWHLQAPVDAVIVNAGGSHTSRQQLVREMRRDRGRLAGKRILVWQFSVRDLLAGDWKLLSLPD